MCHTKRNVSGEWYKELIKEKEISHDEVSSTADVADSHGRREVQQAPPMVRQWASDLHSDPVENRPDSPVQAVRHADLVWCIRARLGHMDSFYEWGLTMETAAKVSFVLVLLSPFVIPMLTIWWDSRKQKMYKRAKDRAVASHHWESEAPINEHSSVPCVFCGLCRRDLEQIRIRTEELVCTRFERSVLGTKYQHRARLRRDARPYHDKGEDVARQAPKDQIDKNGYYLPHMRPILRERIRGQLQ